MESFELGKKYSIVIAIYLVVKELINVFLGGSITSLILPIVMAIVLILGVKYCNYIVAGLLAVIVITHIGTNLSNIGFNVYLVYTLEGLLDIIVAVFLCINKDIKAFFGG